jgi:hypothetical protein
MIALLCFVQAVLAAPFKSKSRLEAENAALRHQLIELRRKVKGRVLSCLRRSSTMLRDGTPLARWIAFSWAAQIQ